MRAASALPNLTGMRVRPVILTLVLLVCELASGQGHSAEPAGRSPERRAHGGQHVSLRIDGKAAGDVRVATGEPKTIAMTASSISPGLAAVLGELFGGSSVRKELQLQDGAAIRRVSGAVLRSVRMPAVGSGGAPDVELTWEVAAVTTRMALTPTALTAAKEPPRIGGVHAIVEGLAAPPATAVGAFTVTPHGAPSLTDVVLELPAGGARPFAAWQAERSLRRVRVTYVDADDNALVELALEGCTAASVVPTPPTARATLRCARVARP